MLCIEEPDDPTFLFWQLCDGVVKPDIQRFVVVPACVLTFGLFVKGYRRNVIPPKMPVAVFENDSAKPAGEGTRIPQLSPFFPGIYKRFLCDIFGKMVVPHDAIRGTHRHVLKPTDEFAERVCIPRTCQNNDRAQTGIRGDVRH